MKRPQSVDELTKLSYAERQLLTFVQDEVWEAELQAQQAPPEDKPIWLTIVRILGATYLGSYGVLIQGIYEAYKKLKESGELISTAPFSWTQKLSLLPGHPRDYLLYVGHPVQSDTYVPAADFHRIVFEHKFAEALSLLMHLGAKTCVVRHQIGWNRDFASSLSVGIPEAGVGAGVQGGSSSASDKSLLYEAEFEGHNNPSLPDQLVWYHHEPTWKQLAEGRLKFGLRKFSLQLIYNDDFSVNAGLKLKAEKAGFDLGGKFTDHVTTSWSISGTFA